jgi:phosphatidate cytidylyltransferase
VPADEPASTADDKDLADSTRHGDLAPRVFSALVLAPLAVAAAYAGGWPFGAFWLVAAIGVWWEWSTLVSGSMNRVLFVLGATPVALAMVLAEMGMSRTPILIIVLGALGAGVFARADRRVWTAAGLLYAGAILLGSLTLRRDPELGLVALLFLFAIVWATDTCAFFAGRALDGPKLAPAISPHKTWAGAVGGAIGAVLAGLAVAEVAGLDNGVAIVFTALLLSIAAQGGDLFESALKRRFGAKDASHLIPGHGGFMDRLDGFAAAVAAAAVFGVLRAGLDSAAQGLLHW